MMFLILPIYGQTIVLEQLFIKLIFIRERGVKSYILSQSHSSFLFQSMSTDSDEGVKEDDNYKQNGGYHVIRKDKAIAGYGGNNEENLTTKEMSARLAAKESIRVIFYRPKKKVFWVVL